MPTHRKRVLISNALRLEPKFVLLFLVAIITPSSVVRSPNVCHIDCGPLLPLTVTPFKLITWSTHPGDVPEPGKFQIKAVEQIGTGRDAHAASRGSVF